MGSLSAQKAIVACLLLGAAAFLVHLGNAGAEKVFSGAKIAESQLVEENWLPGGEFPMEPIIVEALHLDDFTFRPYRKGREQVTLYIGFYHTAEKVGAAHDPMVCFQGQGWTLGDYREGLFTVSGDAPMEVRHSSVLAELGGRRELVLYWFQSLDKTNAGTFGQKMSTMMNRLMKRGGANAFVRVTTTIGSESREEAEKRIEMFVGDFYPRFHRYITQQEQG